MNTRVLPLLSLLIASSSASADMFELRGTTQNAAGGFVHPAMLVGFNPQPDPPSENTFLDLRDPMGPVLNTSALPPGPVFELILGLEHPDTTSEFMGFEGMTPNTDGFLDFNCLFGDGTSFLIRLHLTSSSPLDRLSWTGFDPQPDPPMFPGAIGFTFGLQSPQRGDVLHETVSLTIEVLNGQERVSWEIPSAPTTGLALIAAVPMFRRRR